MRRLGITAFLFFLQFVIYGQTDQWRLISRFSATDIDRVSLDNGETIYYSDTGGTVYKVDIFGDILSRYSPLYRSKIDQLDAFFTTTLFVFSKDLQHVVLLDRSLAPVNVLSPLPADLGVIKAATLGNGHVLWTVDEQGLSLKKYDYRRNEVLQDQPLSLVLTQDRIEVVEIQERQNMLFMNLKNEGVFVFDNQGNFIVRRAVNLDQNLSFLKDHLYYVKNGELGRLNIFSGKEDVYPLPDPSLDKIAVSASWIILYSAESMLIYDHPRF